MSSLYNTSTGEPWYHSHTAFSKTFTRMSELSKEYQVIIATEINEHIRMNHYLAEERRDLKSLGAQTVLHLYSSRNKNYWFSDNPDLSQAINTIVYLRPERRSKMMMMIKICVESSHQFLKNAGYPEDAQTSIKAIAENIFRLSLDDVESSLLRKVTVNEKAV